MRCLISVAVKHVVTVIAHMIVPITPNTKKSSRRALRLGRPIIRATGKSKCAVSTRAIRSHSRSGRANMLPKIQIRFMLNTALTTSAQSRSGSSVHCAAGINAERLCSQPKGHLLRLIGNPSSYGSNIAALIAARSRS